MLCMFHVVFLSYMEKFLSVLILFMLCLNMVSGLCSMSLRHAVQGREPELLFSLAWRGMF